MIQPPGQLQISFSPTQNADFQQGQFPESCVICLEDLPFDSKVRLLPCGHVFHYPCIDDWLQIRDVRCPICGETFYHLCTPKERKQTRPRESRQSSSQSNSQNSEPGHTKLHALKLWCRKVVNSQTQVPSRPRRASISQEL